MDLWNIRDLLPPPINRCKCEIKSGDVKLLNSVLREGLDFFESQHYLSTEAAVLSRTIYRMKMKFRSSKDFKSIEKLNRALRNYLQMKITFMLDQVIKTMPNDYTNKMRLPTKNMIDYILVRLQGLAKLLWRLLETCKVSAHLFRKRLHLGHMWNVAAIIFAMISRIFVLVKSMIKYTCEMYGNLYPFSEKLQNTGVYWLPVDYHLPESLSTWLDIDWLDLEAVVIEIEDNTPPITSFFSLIDGSDDEVEISDEYVMIKDDESDLSVLICDEDVKVSNLFNNDVDVGEPIEIEESIVCLDSTVEVGESSKIQETNKRKQKKKKTKKRAFKIANNQNSPQVSSNNKNKRKRYFL